MCECACTEGTPGDVRRQPRGGGFLTGTLSNLQRQAVSGGTAAWSEFGNLGRERRRGGSCQFPEDSLLSRQEGKAVGPCGTTILLVSVTSYNEIHTFMKSRCPVIYYTNIKTKLNGLSLRFEVHKCQSLDL